jgi:multidrug efflux pump subunit AcrA (membrane-fusion protein)
MKIDEIETNSEQIREILEKPPATILKWGISILFIIVSALFFAAWVIKYPTVIPSQITITTQIPPHKIVAQSSGKITQLFVQENELVKTNQTLAIIQNTAQFSDVEFVHKEVKKNTTILDNDSLINFQFKTDLKLGSIQTAYTNFKNAYEEFGEYKALRASNREAQILSTQININKGKLNSQSKQIKMYRNELTLAEKDYKRDQELFGKEVISIKELEDKKRSLLAAKRNYEQVKNSSSNVEMIISNLKKDINSITITSIESNNRLSRNVKETYAELKNAILSWRQQYLFVSPIEGRVSFFNFWAKNQHVNIGDEVLSIVPKATHQIIGRMLMPIQNSGQVKQGQKVIIRLAAYPFQEYGMLIGTIKNISLLPSQETYAVEVGLPNQLTTTFKKKIELKSELSGTAEVITEDLRLLERVFYQLRKIFSQ